MISFPPEVISRIAWAGYNGVLNVRDPFVVDRRQMPYKSLLSKRIESAPLIGADGVIIKYKLQSNLDLQGWERKDPLAFGEQNLELETQFPWSNIHEGWEVVHDDLEAAVGGVVLPNGQPGKGMVRSDSRSEAFRLVDYFKEGIESMMDKFDVSEDQLLLRDNSSDPKLPQGFDAYWPIGSCPGMTSDGGGTRGYYNLGTVGGKSRAAYPEALQHYVWYGMTYGAAGSARIAMRTARREAELRSRGRSKGGIRAMLCGARALDKYVKFATQNDSNYTQAVTVLNNGGSKQLDIGIPDSGLQFEGIPMVHCPTFELLDRLDAPAIPWTDTILMIDTESLALCYAPGKQKYFSAPPDEGTVRLSRLSLDSKLVLLPKILNANARLAFTA
jgi:hypothetical protein